MMILHTRDDPPPAVLGAKRPAEPYARILRALLRAGYTIPQLAKRVDFSAVAIRNVALGVTEWVYPETASAIEELVPLLPSESEVVA